MMSDLERAVMDVERAFDFMIGEFDGCSDFDTEGEKQRKRNVIALIKSQAEEIQKLKRQLDEAMLWR